MPSPTHWQLEEASRGSSVQQGSLRGNPPQPCDDAERLRGTARISSCWPCPCSAPCTTPTPKSLHGEPGGRSPEGRRPHAALATTYRSWEGSWGPWGSLPGCAWRWPSSSEPARLRSVAWPPSCHPGPGDTRGRRLMQEGSAIAFHGSEPRRTPLLTALAACSAPQISPGAGIRDVPAPPLLAIAVPATTAVGR